MPKGTATYSPEDNKLRLYPSHRLDTGTYQRVTSAGFSWAPKQELFVAPAWSPSREDLLIELCEEIEDEDKGLVDRAEDRADRFGDYSEKRANDADRAHKTVKAIADNIPFGQPILVGHHSEKHARKHAAQIENGMRHAVKMWETAQYWEQRAAGAIRAAKYKERPDVRARRVKTIEAEKRKVERNKSEAEKWLAMWTAEGLTLDGARQIANVCWFRCIAADGHDWTAYDVLQPDESRYKACPAWTVEQVQDAARRSYPATIANCDRWLNHLNNRLAYERAMLAEGGGLKADGFDFQIGGQVKHRFGWNFIKRINRKEGIVCSLSLINTGYPGVVNVEDVTDYKPPTQEEAATVAAAIKTAPICNYPGDIALINRYDRNKIQPPVTAQEMTKAQWAKVYKDYRGTQDVAATETTARHRVRITLNSKTHNYDPVYLTDEKRKDPPPLTAPEPPRPKLRAQQDNSEPRTAYKTPEPTVFDAMRDTLKGGGVKTVAVPQLFPTPSHLAAKMADLAEIKPGDACADLSAGTGILIGAMGGRMFAAACGSVTAVEIHAGLCDKLRADFPLTRVICADFLQLTSDDCGMFDKIIINPPFGKGADIKHIKHAMGFLNPGGKLVAICAGGPRQAEQLKPLADFWHQLPPGTFADQGTNVNTVLLTIRN